MQNETVAAADVVECAKHVSILNHLRDSQNLMLYLVFTAWCKIMGISSYIPSVTIG